MQAIIFDLDETLIDRNAAVENFAPYIWSQYISQGELSQNLFVENVISLDQHDYLPRAEFFARMFQSLVDAIPSKKVIEDSFYAQVWETPTSLVACCVTRNMLRSISDQIIQAQRSGAILSNR